jgi:predicted RNase H-like HicB family nuclease
MKYCIVIEQDEDGIFLAQVRSLPGCVSRGHSRQEAVEKARDEAIAYLESLGAQDAPISTHLAEKLAK